MEEEKAKLIQYIFKELGINLPHILLKQKATHEIERVLRTEQLDELLKFIKTLCDDPEKYINVNGIDDCSELIKNISENVEFQKRKISEDDEKIINFLIEHTTLKPKDFLNMLGHLYFVLQVTEKLEKTKNLSRVLKMSLLMWCFLNLYELILLNIDRRLRSYLQKNSKKNDDSDIKKFLEANQKRPNDHATAGLINKVLCEILSLNEENNSIFGKNSKPRIIRNKIAHYNLFYDSEKNKLVSSNFEEYSFEDFLENYYLLSNFLLRSFNMMVANNKFDKDTMIQSFKETFCEAYHILNNKIQNPEQAKEIYRNLIRELKKEQKQNDFRHKSIRLAYFDRLLA